MSKQQMCMAVLQVEYGLNSYGGPSLTHHALPFSIQGGPNFVVSQAGCSMHRADLDPPLHYHSTPPLHPSGLKTLPGTGSAMAHASMLDSSPVDLSGHKMALGQKEEHRRHYSQAEMVGRHYQRGSGVTVGIPDQSHGNHLVCELWSFCWYIS